MAREIKFRAWDKKYEVGSDGTVWSLDYNHTGKRKQMNVYLDRDGYPYVFFVRGKRIKKMVHRLVAELFLEKPSEKHQVNHINGVRDDNRLENLEWVTARQNTLHGWRVNGRKASDKQIALKRESFKGTNNPKAKIIPEIVLEIRKFKKLGRPLKELAMVYHLSVSQVSGIATGRSWSHIQNPELLNPTPNTHE